MKTISFSFALFVTVLAVASENKVEIPLSEEFKIELVFERPQPTYQWIRSNIFQPKCVRCHGGIFPRGGYRLT